MSNLSYFIKYHRKQQNLTQEELSFKAGVGIRFIREIEQGKESLQLDKVEQVLSLFGFSLLPKKKMRIDAYLISLKYINDINLKNLNKPVKITLNSKIVKYGFLIKEIIDKEENQISAWQFITNNNAIKYHKKQADKLIEIISHKDIISIEEQE